MVNMTPKRIASLEEIFHLCSTGINEPNAVGETPIFLAVRAKQRDVVASLLQGNPDLTHKNMAGDTVLIIGACVAMGVDIVSDLIEAGAPLNDQDKEGQTPLMVAARNNNLDTVKALVNAGADLNVRDNHGFTALTRAAFTSDREVLHLLLSTNADLAGLEGALYKRREMESVATGLKAQILSQSQPGS